MGDLVYLKIYLTFKIQLFEELTRNSPLETLSFMVIVMSCATTYRLHLQLAEGSTIHHVFHVLLIEGIKSFGANTLCLLGILNANRKIRKRTDTDVAFTREYSRVSIFHREREYTN